MLLFDCISPPSECDSAADGCTQLATGLYAAGVCSFEQEDKSASLNLFTDAACTTAITTPVTTSEVCYTYPVAQAASMKVRCASAPTDGAAAVVVGMAGE